MCYASNISSWIFVLTLYSVYSVTESFNDLACREAIFKTVMKGQPLEEYVISSHHVDSWFECSGKCLDSKNCVSLSHMHRTTSRDDINCIIASETGGIVVGNSNEVDSWTIYEIKKTGSKICQLTNQPCKNGGTCVENSCEPEGYMCTCSEWYYGKYCESENSDEMILEMNVIGKNY